MPLIEGIGDEVILVLGGFLLCLVLVLAWFSTHTADIPFLRGVGVIVVELSQRRTQTHVEPDADGRSRPEGQDSDAQIETQSGTAVVANTGGEGRNREQQEQTDSPHNSEDNSQSINQPTCSTRPDSEETSTLPQAAERLVAGFEAQERSSDEKRESSELESQGDTDSLVPPASVTVGLNESGGQALFEEAEVLTEEEVRRRRVQYFQSGRPSTEFSNTAGTAHSSVLESSDQPVNHTRTTSEQSDSSRPRDNQFSSDAFSEHLSPPQNEDDVASRIRVKLKYMNETQRLVYASPYDTIGDFRRAHFQSELEENKWVRFIYNGQDLRDDARTLQACNICDNSTMHCLITAQARARPGAGEAHDDEDDSFFGAMMYPMFSLLLVVVWYLRFTYRQYFSAMSTVCLVGITFLLGLSYFSSLQNRGQQPAQATGGTGTDQPQNHPHSD